MRLLAAALITASFASGHAFAQANLLTNGDFEAAVGPGGEVGFTSGYTYAQDQVPENTIYVNTDPHLDHPSWSSFSAYSGSNMLIVNGGATPSLPVWEEAGISVAADQYYTFTGYVAANYPANPALIGIGFNGATTGSPFTVSTTPGLWEQFSFTWYSGDATSLDVTLLDLNPVADGNDFAVDALSLTQSSVPEPASAALLIMGLSVVGVVRRRRAAQARV